MLEILTIFNKNISTRIENEIVRFIGEKLDTFENTQIVFEFADQKIESDLLTLGIKFDNNATIEKVLEESNSKNLKDSLLKIFNIPSVILPEVKSSSEVYGNTSGIFPGLACPPR